MTAPTWTGGGRHHLHRPGWDRAAGSRTSHGPIPPQLLDWTASPSDGLHLHVIRHGPAAVVLAHRHGHLRDVAAARRVPLAPPAFPLDRDKLDVLEPAALELLDAYTAWEHTQTGGQP